MTLDMPVTPNVVDDGFVRSIAETRNGWQGSRLAARREAAPGYDSLVSLESSKAADGDRLADGPHSAEVLTLRVQKAALLRLPQRRAVLSARVDEECRYRPRRLPISELGWQGRLRADARARGENAIAPELECRARVR